jgi:hypothetical protein
MREMKLSAVRRRAVKFGALGEGEQGNYVPTEKTQSDRTFFIIFAKLFSECA